MTSWIVTPCEVLLTNSISLCVFALFLVAAGVLWFLKGIGAAAAIPKERVSEVETGREEVFKQRKSVINNCRNRLYIGARSAMRQICIIIFVIMVKFTITFTLARLGNLASGGDQDKLFIEVSIYFSNSP